MKLENFSVHYFLTRSLFLGIGFSLIIGVTKQDSILAFIIGTLLGLIFIHLMNKIQQEKGSKTLNELLTEMKGLGIFLRIVFISYGVILLCEGLTFIQLFASSFFLIHTPIWFISLPLVLLLLRICKNGKTTTFRVATCLFPISLFLTIISLGTLLGYAKLDNVNPLLVTLPIHFLKSVFYYTTLSVSPSILMLLTENNKSNTFSYLLGSLTLILKMFLIIAILGPILATIYRFPEYIILKEIKILDFIEKIENVVALSWIFDEFIYLSMASLLVKELIPKKFNFLHTLLVIASFFIAFLFIGKYYQNELSIYYLFPIITTIIVLLILFTFFFYFFKQKKKQKIAN